MSIPSLEGHIHFEVKFLAGSHVEDCSEQGVELPCLLEFSSVVPVTLTTHVTFSDKWSEKRYAHICYMRV